MLKWLWSICMRLKIGQFESKNGPGGYPARFVGMARPVPPTLGGGLEASSESIQYSKSMPPGPSLGLRKVEENRWIHGNCLLSRRNS